MRRILPVLLLLLTIAPAIAPAFAQAPAEPQLKKLLNDFLAVAGHRPASTADKKMFDRFFADDLIYTRATGAVITKKDVLKSLDEPQPPNTPIATFSAEDVTVKQYGNTAIIAFRLVQKLSDGNTGYYRNTGTFLKRHGKWQAVAWQATPLPLKPPGSTSSINGSGRPGR
jgi:hypothetical protein